MSRDYPRLPIYTFGAQLLESGDLDPVYIALSRVRWTLEQKYRFLVAYWCLYHCGAAAHISQYAGWDFWIELEKAAKNEDGTCPAGGRWPRGHERRHWRGQQAVDSHKQLAARYGKEPEQMVTQLLGTGHCFETMSEAVQSHRGFGPWIAFKVCDMVDRCLGHRVDFATSAAFNGIFKDPWEAAIQLWRVEGLKADRLSSIRPKDETGAVRKVVNHLIEHFVKLDYRAPPGRDRPVGVQEIETILCKWKSHQNGHYPLWNDVDEITAGLEQWRGTIGKSAAAQFAEGMPARGRPS